MLSRPTGFFLVFEGGEGAGKSTQVRLAAESLTAQGLEVVTTREPGGTPTAEVIRSVLLTPEDDPMSDRCEALLFAAARADHVAKVIRPALNQGAVVVCDRFIDSSLAYQGFARALDVAEVAELSRWATEGLVPDLTVLLDIDPAVGVQRAKDGNRMEGEALSFHRAVRAGMRALAEREPQRYVVIDAMRTPAEIASEVSDAITQRLV